MNYDDDNVPIFNFMSNRDVTLNGWNGLIEQEVKFIGEKSAGWLWMHNKSATYFRGWYNWLGVGNLILLGISLIFNSPLLGVDECDGKADWSEIIGLILQGIVLITAGYAQWFRYGERSLNHLTAKANFSSLYQNVKIQLKVDIDERQNGKDYAEWIQKEYTSLSANPDMPAIPQWIRDEYRKKIEDTGLSHPDDIEPIRIQHNFGGNNGAIPKGPLELNINPTVNRNVHQLTHNPHTVGGDVIINIPQPQYFTEDSDDSDLNVRPSRSKSYNPRVMDTSPITIPRRLPTEREKWQLERFYSNPRPSRTISGDINKSE